MFFTRVMGLKYVYASIGVIMLFLFTGLYPSANQKDKGFGEVVKIALREVGNQLLLANNDSTSLVMPVEEIAPDTYLLSFQKELSIHPDSLVSLTETVLLKSDLPKFYRVEVLQCNDGEVAYSFERKDDIEQSIIPCSGRIIPQNCYRIEVKFTTLNIESANTPLIFFGLSGVLVLLFIGYKKKNKPEASNYENKTAARIGSFHFYPDQNKLVKATSEIQLSKKECELLEIFIENINTIVKRDELVKRVWEDQGVFVSRSLDTYISKLRKKFSDDPSVQITNIHGVGYKLEVKD